MKNGPDNLTVQLSIMIPSFKATIEAALSDRAHDLDRLLQEELAKLDAEFIEQMTRLEIRRRVDYEIESWVRQAVVNETAQLRAELESKIKDRLRDLFQCPDDLQETILGTIERRGK